MRILLTASASAAIGLVLLASVGLAQQQASSAQAVCSSGTGTAQISLLNPKAGDALPNGASMVLEGVAFDPGASQGTGIDSVNVFLDDRESGGQFLGTATLGQADPGVAPGSQFSTAGFTLRTNALPSGWQAWTTALSPRLSDS